MIFLYLTVIEISHCYDNLTTLIMIAPNSRARKGGKKIGEVKREYGGIRFEEEGNADYRRISNMLHHV